MIGPWRAQTVTRGAVRRAEMVLTLLVAVVLVTGLLPGSAEAGTGSWSTPVEISGKVGGWFPDVAADNSGRVHVVWQSGFSDTTSVDIAALYYAGRFQGTWSTPNDIALVSPAGVALRSSIAADQEGRLHLIYKGLGSLASDRLTNENLWATAARGDLAGSVQAWRSPTRLTRFDQGYYSDLAVDASGVVHAIWTESALGNWGLFYAHSSDGGITWSEPVALDAGKAVWWYRAHLKIDSDNRLHVVWEIIDPALGNNSPYGYGTTKATVYATSKDGGTTWTAVAFTSNGQPESYATLDVAALNRDTAQAGPQQPTVGIDGRGNIVLVFREPKSNHVLYRVSADGQVWSSSLPIPGIQAGIPRPFDVYDLATDSAGHLHLVMVGVPNGANAMALLHSEWDGQQWADPQTIASAPLFPEYPKIAIGEGRRLHVVWFDGDAPGVDRHPVGIWYSTAITTAPAIVASHQATSSAGPLSTMTPAAPTATPELPNPATPRVVTDALVPRQDSVSLSEWLTNVPQSPDFPLVVGVAPVASLLLILFMYRILVKGMAQRGPGQRR